MASFQDLLKKVQVKIAETKKSSFPWRRDEPCLQPYYTYSEEQDVWLPQSSPPSPPNRPGPEIKSLEIYTWNIDFMIPYSDKRMSAAISHLETLLFPRLSSSSPSSTPSLILLQECLASDLVLLQKTPWIRKHFALTDLTPEFWESGYYGTATLVDLRLPIQAVFRVHYASTNMERDGLFVDISLPSTTPITSKSTSSTHSKIVRICNTHLESLALSPPLRPAQLATASKFMHETSISHSLSISTPNAAPPQTLLPLISAILAGDLNAIQPFDASLPQSNNLSDAWLTTHPQSSDSSSDDDDESHTWTQPPTALLNQFGSSRMDKILFCGSGIRARTTELFGRDVEVEDDSVKEKLCREVGCEKAWVTDHLGVRAVFDLD